MISIPVSFLLAVVFTVLLVSVPFWRAFPVWGRACFAVLLAVLALESGLVGMRFALEIEDLVLLQRVLPVWIAPVAYLSFFALTCEPERLMARAWRHAVVAACASGVILAPIPLSGLIDGVITLSYLCYAILLARLWRRGPDIYSQVPTRLMNPVRQFLLISLLLLAGTLVVDVVIAILFSVRDVDAAASLVSYATLGVLLAIVFLTVWIGGRISDKKSTPQPVSRTVIDTDTNSEKGPGAADRERMVEIVSHARQLLLDQELYKDAGLTLTRLARRTGVPDRDLSQAVNQIAGVSISQFVNQLRLEEAARLLRETQEPATQILDKVGFLTRSNFYREFQKHFGMSPGAYRSNN